MEVIRANDDAYVSMTIAGLFGSGAGDFFWRSPCSVTGLSYKTVITLLTLDKVPSHSSTAKHTSHPPLLMIQVAWLRLHLHTRSLLLLFFYHVELLVHRSVGWFYLHPNTLKLVSRDQHTVL